MAQVTIARVTARAITPVPAAQVHIAKVSATATGTGASARVAIARVAVAPAGNAKMSIFRVTVVSHVTVQGSSNQYTYDGASKTWVPTGTFLWDAATSTLT